MNQKLIKSTTEVNLALPLKKHFKQLHDHYDYSSVPLSKESPTDRVPTNTPKKLLKPPTADKFLHKKLANMLDVNPLKHYKTMDATENVRSPTKSPSQKAKKLLKSNLTKIFGPNTTNEIDPQRSKELAKLALSKIMAREMIKKKKVEPKNPTIQKTASTAHLRPSTQDNLKVPTPQKDIRSKKKPPQINVVYNESAIIENLGKNKQRSPQSFVNYQSPANKSLVNLIPQTTTNASSHYQTLGGKQTIVPLHTPQSSQHSANREASNPRGKVKKKKPLSIGNTLFGREFIQYSSGNVAPKPVNFIKHKRVASGNQSDNPLSSSMAQGSVNHSNIASKKNINYSCVDTVTQFDNEVPEPQVLQQKRVTFEPVITDNALDPEHFKVLSNAFSNLIENYQYDLSNSKNNFQLLKTIKQAYEQYIEGILNVLPDVNLLQADRDETKREYIKCMQEKTELKEDLERTKQENAKLQKFILSMKKERSSMRSSAVVSEKRAHSDSPDTGFHNKLSKETDTLKRKVESQELTIHNLREKEAKLITLVLAIKKRGIDVEKIYAEDVRGKEDLIEEEKEESPEEIFHETPEEIPSSRSSQSGIISSSRGVVRSGDQGGSSHKKLGKHSSEAKSSISNALTAVSSGVRQFQNTGINTAVKSKLKLDLTGLNKPGQKEGEEPESADAQLGFHEEFMSKLGEFSLSWRQAAIAERKFQQMQMFEYV